MEEGQAGGTGTMAVAAQPFDKGPLVGLYIPLTGERGLFTSKVSFHLAWCLIDRSGGVREDRERAPDKPKISLLGFVGLVHSASSPNSQLCVFPPPPQHVHVEMCMNAQVPSCACIHLCIPFFAHAGIRRTSCAVQLQSWKQFC